MTQLLTTTIIIKGKIQTREIITCRITTRKLATVIILEIIIHSKSQEGTQIIRVGIMTRTIIKIEIIITIIIVIETIITITLTPNNNRQLLMKLRKPPT